MDAQVSFIGMVVPSGKSVTIAADFDDDEFETIHFTQVALGPKPAKGPHTIFIENEDGKFAVGTLDREKCTQFSLDITIACDDVSISHSGDSDVHLTGYRTVAVVGLDELEDYEDGEADGMRLYRKGELGSSSDDDDEDDDEEEDEEEESSEDDEPPRAVPLQKKKNQLVEDEASEGSSSEEEEEDDISEEDGSESEEEEEDSEEEEEEPPSKSAKRKKAAAAQTPQPAKKAKTADVATAPATAPAKVGAPNGESPANDKAFAAALKSFLQKNGPCKLSVLGSSVKRPPNTPKFKKVIEQNSDIFSFNPVTDTVSLAN